MYKTWLDDVRGAYMKHCRVRVHIQADTNVEGIEQSRRLFGLGLQRPHILSQTNALSRALRELGRELGNG